MLKDVIDNGVKGLQGLPYHSEIRVEVFYSSLGSGCVCAVETVTDSWLLCGVTLVIEVLVECHNEGPVVIELLLAEFNGVKEDINFKLEEGVLKYPKVD